ncbi:hypothetical protein [Nocardia brasiliensis]|nr:hypothetical protein [Nocardia brasiliensis]
MTEVERGWFRLSGA